MSGPIVRKYGFANFEKIFGERELKHGVEGGATTPQVPETPADPPKSAQASEPNKDHKGPTRP